MALETALAEAQWDKVRNRDPQATYNLVSPAEFDDLTGGLDSDAFLAGVGVSVVSIMGSPL